MKMVSIPEEELERLKEKNREQGRQLKIMSETLHQKNLDLDALHFVWCDGGCPRGIHRYSEVRLTEEMISRAERNTRRMRRWYNTVKWRLTKYPSLSEWHRRRAEDAASRTDFGDDMKVATDP